MLASLPHDRPGLMHRRSRAGAAWCPRVPGLSNGCARPNGGLDLPGTACWELAETRAALRRLRDAGDGSAMGRGDAVAAVVAPW